MLFVIHRGLWLRVSKFAALLGLHSSTVYRRIGRGEIDAVRIRRECVRCVMRSTRSDCSGCLL